MGFPRGCAPSGGRLLRFLVLQVRDDGVKAIESILPHYTIPFDPRFDIA